MPEQLISEAMKAYFRVMRSIQIHSRYGQKVFVASLTVAAARLGARIAQEEML